MEWLPWADNPCLCTMVVLGLWGAGQVRKKTEWQCPIQGSAEWTLRRCHVKTIFCSIKAVGRGECREKGSRGSRVWRLTRRRGEEHA